ncbi:baculoviral IAP repeat-containing protein 2 [Aplysia californica]|uniref:Baculoviral IAP repeat-containing protein 2 n=1 Tax=Aplysia californica TaxID=6500 RepID=A0ABM0JK35_APLCA|nr:baculoviral IAP repeat-containing protein 2 [Aplysia californica]
MDDGGRMSRSGSAGHDIGPDEVYSGRYQENPAENGLRPVYMVRNVHPGNSLDGMDVGYETVMVSEWPRYEPVDNSPSEAWTRESSNSGSNSSYLYHEQHRLDTFRTTWSDTYPVRATDLARNGFYYIGPRDRVKCVFCLKILSSWEAGDVVEAEHRRHSRNCPFIQGLCHDKNILICASADISRNMRVHMKSDDCMHPEYSEVYERLRTYERWPLSTTVSPERLADAGLFYSGHTDVVKCFHCGKTLRKWEPGDDPFHEHARLYPECPFVKEKKRKMEMERGGHQPSSVAGSRTGAAAGPSSPLKNGYHKAEVGEKSVEVEDQRQCTEPGEPPLPSLEQDMQSPAARAVLQLGDMTVEELRRVLQALRLSKGPDGKIASSDILEFYDGTDKKK